MNVVRNLSIRAKLTLLTAFLLLLLFMTSLLNRQTLNQVKVMGPIYTEIASGKDLIADILPPPAYIIESYLASHALADAETPVEVAELTKKLSEHKAAFTARLEHWTNTLPEGALKDALLGEANGTAVQYFQIADQKLIPLVQEKKLDDARMLVSGELKEIYLKHHAAIGTVVTLADEHNRRLEASTLETLNSASWWAGATAIIVSALVGIVIWLTSRNATRRLSATRELARGLAAGDFSRRLNVVGGDEIDQMGSELSDASRTLDGAISAMVQSMEAATKQDFSRVLTQDLPGELNRGKVALNDMLSKLTELYAESQENKALAAAVGKSQAVVELAMDGTLITANQNFLSIVGYSLDELRGKHHSQLVEPAHAASSEYRGLWAQLNGGQYAAGEFKRIGKGGKEIWLLASYNPIVDQSGKPYKVVKYATDITRSKQMEASIIERQRSDAQQAEELKANVAQILDVANRVSHGDYSVEIAVSGEDSVGQLGQGLRKFFADKKVAEAAERDRNEREREEAERQKQKVQQVLQIVNAVADGNFDLTVPDLGDDAVGQVAKALDSAVESIRKALLAVRGVAQTVASAASQMTSASSEISRGAQNQASSLEETASSLEEITSTVKQNTDNAQQARQLANGSRDVAEKGGHVVGEAVKAMGEINAASTRISDIITTIDEIAFQTNLLALNAAVEAARAGEQGRGFAVVAAEVRNLAQRSATAAKEIKTLIQDSVRKVENGTSLVNQSGRTLEEIVGSVKRVTDIVAEIAAASKEQLTGVEQVNKAVAQMDRVTQNNASQTEEMAGTAEALLTHSKQLSELVERFKLEGEEKTPAKSSRRTEDYQAQKQRVIETNLDRVVNRLQPAAVAAGAGFVEF
jgi:PAS domain S-box-containing protein